ncbi:MAG: hypothetical protein AAF927_20680 [Bacteroidota bacterium]
MSCKITLFTCFLILAQGYSFAKPRVETNLTASQSPIIFSLSSVKSDWQNHQYFLTRTQNGIESKIELEQAPSDWEVINDQQVLVLNGASDLQILDFRQPNAIKYVHLDVGSVDLLEIATFDGGFYFVSAEAEHLAFMTDALWRYEWDKEDYTSVAIPDSLNMIGLSCSKDGQELAFAHTITCPAGENQEVYQLMYFDLASQNAQILDQGSQSKAERFVKDRAKAAIHFQNGQNLVYLKSEGGKMNVYQMNLKTSNKRLLSSLPFYISNIVLDAQNSFSYRSKGNYIVHQNWTTGKCSKQAIPAGITFLSLRYHR